MATGLLIVGVNSGTKLLQYVSGSTKTYLATMRFGVTTTTDDVDGEVVDSPGCSSLTAEAFEDAARDFRGEILQVPTSVSAIKVDGKRAYARVRAGEKVELAARPITVQRLEGVRAPREASQFVAGVAVPVVDVDVEVECSSGTYIRALARDLGRELGVGGHLTSLRRTSIGPWDVVEASPLARLEKAVTSGNKLPLLPLGVAGQVLFPTVVITEAAAARFRHGQAPVNADVVAVRGHGRGGNQSGSKAEGVHAVELVGAPGSVLGLIREDRGSRLGWKTVSVFTPDGV